MVTQMPALQPTAMLVPAMGEGGLQQPSTTAPSIQAVPMGQDQLQPYGAPQQDISQAVLEPASLGVATPQQPQNPIAVQSRPVLPQALPGDQTLRMPALQPSSMPVPTRGEERLQQPCTMAPSMQVVPMGQNQLQYGPLDESIDRPITYKEWLKQQSATEPSMQPVPVGQDQLQPYRALEPILEPASLGYVIPCQPQYPTVLPSNPVLLHAILDDPNLQKAYQTAAPQAVLNSGAGLNNPATMYSEAPSYGDKVPTLNQDFGTEMLG